MSKIKEISYNISNVPLSTSDDFIINNDFINKENYEKIINLYKECVDKNHTERNTTLNLIEDIVENYVLNSVMKIRVKLFKDVLKYNWLCGENNSAGIETDSDIEIYNKFINMYQLQIISFSTGYPVVDNYFIEQIKNTGCIPVFII